MRARGLKMDPGTIGQDGKGESRTTACKVEKPLKVKSTVSKKKWNCLVKRIYLGILYSATCKHEMIICIVVRTYTVSGKENYAVAVNRWAVVCVTGNWRIHHPQSF